MKKIDRNSKILSLSHNDLDGVTAQIVLGHVFENIDYLNTSYFRIDDVMQSINFKKYDWVFLTDISPSEMYLMELSDNIVLLDHHETAKKFHDPKNMRFVTENMCAAKFTKKFVEKYYNISLHELNDLVRLTNDYDMWIHKDPLSKQINDLMFYRYHPDKFRELYFDGHTTFTQDEIYWLEERKKKFQQIYDSLNAYEFDTIKGCLVESKEFINEIAEKLMKEESYRIVFIRNPSHGRVSIRHNLGKQLNMGAILEQNKWGGGHAESAGLMCNNDVEFKQRVDALEKIIYEVCQESHI
jgi:oligoribonuclease NrnB/cAMP/cGMP phosphodiesterase (DHH superfamily)